jgi:hypothetical protein
MFWRFNIDIFISCIFGKKNCVELKKKSVIKKAQVNPKYFLGAGLGSPIGCFKNATEKPQCWPCPFDRNIVKIL